MFREYSDEVEEQEEIQEFTNEIITVTEKCGKLNSSERCEKGIEFFKCWLKN